MFKRLPFFRQSSQEPMETVSTALPVDRTSKGYLGYHKNDAPPLPRRDSFYDLHGTAYPRGKVLMPVLVPGYTVPAPSTHGILSIRNTGGHIAPCPVTPQVASGPTVSLFPTLRIPLLPLIHLLLLSTHLGLAAATPYLLVQHMIQPIVLWLILAVCLVLQALYLVPGIILEIIGLCRGRAM